jgi:hypothetical protein
VYALKRVCTAQVAPDSVILVATGEPPNANTTAAVVDMYKKLYPSGPGGSVMGYWLVSAPGKVNAPPDIAAVQTSQARVWRCMRVR